MTGTPIRKPGRAEKALRLVLSALDPRAWFHLVRLVNHYNHTHVTPRRQATIGPGAAISPTVGFSNAGRIRAGRNLRLGTRCLLWAGPGHGRIEIGDDVMFGPDVTVTAASYRYNDGRPVTKQAMDEATVTIGSDAWLGARVLVLPGVTIGEGAIVGAGAVVVSDIPPWSVAVGVPARVVGRRRLPGMAADG
jgi:acetyltransferase-like isoleucine patch superfamily enzyme